MHHNSTKHDAKCKQIELALAEDPVDMESLQRLAQSDGGLINDQYRSTVWPKLLAIPDLLEAQKQAKECMLQFF